MSVYVDDAFVRGEWGRWRGGGHLQADSAAELHAFAERLGLERSQFQSKPGRPEHDHYDLTAHMRRRAIDLGAESQGWRDTARRNIRLRRVRESGSS
jgi:hypothetical protein